MGGAIDRSFGILAFQEYDSQRHQTPKYFVSIERWEEKIEIV
jgi:hypothetical protein